jgi:hypothetical protein
VSDYTSTPENACPACGKRLDAATSTSDPAHVTSEGDVSICIYCAGVAVFKADLTLRTMTPEEWLEMPLEHRKLVKRAQGVVIEQIGKRATHGQ